MKTSFISCSIFILSIFISCHTIAAAKSSVQVSLTWTYKNFPLKIQVYKVTPAKTAFISETRIVKDLKSAPIEDKITAPIKVEIDSSYPAVLVVENNTDKDAYFFAVPHEVHPVSASAGHFFECLCIGRLYKVPKKSVWYRIVRININSSFQDVKKFDIEHQIIGKTEAEANGPEKDRLYNY